MIISIMISIYLCVLFCLDHIFLIALFVAILSFVFFFLSAATKLGPLASIGGMLTVYLFITFVDYPIGEKITRSILYSNLFMSIPATLMMTLGVIISPSPKKLLTDQIAYNIKLSISLLKNKNTSHEKTALYLIHSGPEEMLKYVHLASSERMWDEKDLIALKQAAISSLSLLSVSLDISKHYSDESPEDLINSLEEIYTIFSKGNYPIDIPHVHIQSDQLPLRTIPDILVNFTTPPNEISPSKVTEKPPQKKQGFFVSDAFTNPTYVGFALKGTAAVFISYLIFKALDWPGIHTCIITCFLVALPRVGEMISKELMRFIGSLIGGGVSILSIIYLFPHMDEITLLSIIIFIMSLLSGWLKAGDSRISYGGFQLGLTFFLCILKDFGPTTDMTTARDRIVGVLIGNLVTYAVFSSIWPKSSFETLAKKITTISQMLQKQLQSTTIQEKEEAFASTQSAIEAGKLNLEFVQFEPYHSYSKDICFTDKFYSLRQAEKLSYRLLIGNINLNEAKQEIEKLESHLQ
ncbi:FUSC family protein [Swingsia samuiensis]|uniref:FUSC family protein n=1 Tax=Swingsia samuiensis TaxID=1293412 RepID=UPI0015E8DBF4|nr:FUSC family protein [Swingsia samuiensis]